MEAAIENCFEKYVLKIEAMCLNILTVGNCYFIYWLGDWLPAFSFVNNEL